MRHNENWASCAWNAGWPAANRYSFKTTIKQLFNMNSRTKFRLQDLTFLRPGGCGAELSATGACDAEHADSRKGWLTFMLRKKRPRIFSPRAGEYLAGSTCVGTRIRANNRSGATGSIWCAGALRTIGADKIRSRAAIAFGIRRIWRIASEGLRNQRVREGAQFRHGVRYSNSMAVAYARSNMANSRSRQSRRPERQLL